MSPCRSSHILDEWSRFPASCDSRSAFGPLVSEPESSCHVLEAIAGCLGPSELRSGNSRVSLYILWDWFPSNLRDPLTLSISPRASEVRQPVSTFESQQVRQSVSTFEVSQSVRQYVRQLVVAPRGSTLLLLPSLAFLVTVRSTRLSKLPLLPSRLSPRLRTVFDIFEALPRRSESCPSSSFLPRPLYSPPYIS